MVHVAESEESGMSFGRSGRLVVALVLLWATAVGCDAERARTDADLKARLQEAVDGFRSSRLVPGASVAVVRGGRLVQVVSGVSDLDTEHPVTAGTRFRMASVAKLYVSTLVLRFVERGALSLDEPIGARVSALPDSLAFARGLTLRQLLSHTSGLGQTLTRDEDRNRALTTADLLARIPPPVCAPGTCWSYADGNYFLTQAVLEATTGRPLSDVFRDELAAAFGLRDTAMVDASVDPTPLPAQYAVVRESGRIVKPRRLFEQRLPRSTTLVTTASDAARFADALFSGAVLRRTTLANMVDTRVMRDLPCPDDCKFGYGLGVFHFAVAGHDLVGHDGSSGAVVVHDQDDEFSVAILTNGGEQDLKSFLETVLHAIDGAT
jgi:CubicO group peptidase (beta-lactamase class C family)